MIFEAPGGLIFNCFSGKIKAKHMPSFLISLKIHVMLEIWKWVSWKVSCIVNFTEQTNRNTELAIVQIMVLNRTVLHPH